MISVEKIIEKFGQLDDFLGILKGIRKTPVGKFLKGILDFKSVIAIKFLVPPEPNFKNPEPK